MLTWRSIANRVWHYHFGRGIVETPNDFGRNGVAPTHPELLDWLAVELRDDGQSLKALHRLIVAAPSIARRRATTRQSRAIDADNRYLWRQESTPARRRGRSATASWRSRGTLDRRMGGPGFELFRFKDDHSPDLTTTPTPPRSIIPGSGGGPSIASPFAACPTRSWRRLDCADPNLNTPVRSQTLTALQALALWNDLFMVRQVARIRPAARGNLERAPLPQQSSRPIASRCWPSRPLSRRASALAAYAAKHGLAHACRLLCEHQRVRLRRLSH